MHRRLQEIWKVSAFWNRNVIVEYQQIHWKLIQTILLLFIVYFPYYLAFSAKYLLCYPHSGLWFFSQALGFLGTVRSHGCLIQLTSLGLLCPYPFVVPYSLLHHWNAGWEASLLRQISSYRSSSCKQVDHNFLYFSITCNFKCTLNGPGIMYQHISKYFRCITMYCLLVFIIAI